MAEFSAAQKYVLANEGGYVNDEHDAGGETYRGISRVHHPNWSGWDTVDAYKPLKKGEIINSGIVDASVNQFYKTHFWDNILGDKIDSQAVATMMYDWSVTSGKAIKKIQALLGVEADGIWGNKSLEALNKEGEGALLKIYDARVAYYKSLNNPHFEKGWLSRVHSLYEKLT